MNYDQLKVDVDNWLARDDIGLGGTSFDSITRLVEIEIGRDFRGFEIETRLTIIATGQRVQLPLDFLQLRYIGPGTITENTPERTGSSDYYYSIEQIGNKQYLLLDPAPTQDSPAEIQITYFRSMPPLEQEATNDLINSHYDLFLWNALKQSCVFLQEFETADLYQSKYVLALTRAHKIGNRKRYMSGQWQVPGVGRPIE